MSTTIRKVSRGRQNRVTVPKEWNTDYVALAPISVENAFKSKRKDKK